jgi:16S rRNA U516 pseudouridylate synthase RsuA-like enzyme
MAERGLCSRRNADDYIARGWVFVDGRRVSELGTRADPAAVIVLDKQAQAQPAKPHDDPAAQADGLRFRAAGARLSRPR